MNETTKKVPPYLSLSRLERVLQIIKTRSLKNAPVNAALFQAYEFNMGDASLAVNFLKFIGAVDADGMPTNAMEMLRLESEDKRREAFEKIVRTAYSDLFEAVKEPHKLTRDGLKDEFRVQYQQSPRIIDSAIPVFLKLAEYGGLVEPGAVRATPKPRSDRPKMDKVTQVKTLKDMVLKTPPTHEEGMHVQHIVKGKMSITLPEDDFLLTQGDDDVSKSWRALIAAAITFSKHLKKEEEGKPGTPM